VIACYRALKGMTDLWPAEKADAKPRLSLALLDAADEQQADRVGSKLLSVCQQFLHWPLELEAHVRVAQRVNQHVVMCCRPIHDKSQVATAPQWQIIADFVARSSQVGTAPTVAKPQATSAPVANIESVVDEIPAALHDVAHSRGSSWKRSSRILQRRS